MNNNTVDVTSDLPSGAHLLLRLFQRGLPGLRSRGKACRDERGSWEVDVMLDGPVWYWFGHVAAAVTYLLTYKTYVFFPVKSIDN